MTNAFQNHLNQQVTEGQASHVVLALAQVANVAEDRCQPSLMFMTGLFSQCAADVIRSLLLLMNNVWELELKVSVQVQFKK